MARYGRKAAQKLESRKQAIAMGLFPAPRLCVNPPRK
jgi:hypothetical protein